LGGGEEQWKSGGGGGGRVRVKWVNVHTVGCSGKMIVYGVNIIG
jgi:hypothetical protein